MARDVISRRRIFCSPSSRESDPLSKEPSKVPDLRPGAGFSWSNDHIRPARFPREKLRARRGRAFWGGISDRRSRLESKESKTLHSIAGRGEASENS
jgi:hypothetical protein